MIDRPEQPATRNPVEVISQELARLDREIVRLRVERDAVLRLATQLGIEAKPLRLRMNGAEREVAKVVRGDMSTAVTRCVLEAGRLKASDVIAAVLREHPDWRANSIKTTLYRLRAEGFLNLQGHWWQTATPAGEGD